MKLLRALGVAGWLIISGGTGFAADYRWPDRGMLSLEAPDTWKVATQGAPGLGFLFKIEAKGSNPATLQMTVVALPAGRSIPESALQSRLRTMTQPALAGSVEKAITPVALKMAQGAGWYGELTDAALVGKPAQKGNFKVMRQGVAALDPSTFVVITMQFDDPAGPEPEQMIGIVESLQFEATAAATGGKQLRIEAVGDFYETHDLDGNLVLKIPRSGLTLQRGANVGGGTASPRYFYFVGTETGLVASGWIEPAARFNGIEQFWKEDLAGSVKAKGPERRNVKFSKRGDWDLISYDVILPTKGVNNSHVRAERVHKGAWIDLHISVTGDRPVPELRAELMAFLAGVEIETR